VLPKFLDVEKERESGATASAKEFGPHKKSHIADSSAHH
jgi:hypothetical protein